MIKRLFDLILAITALILLFPVLIIVYIAILIFLGAPAVYTQTRPGLHGKPFKMRKFRSMTDARDADGNLLPDEVRLTKFGKLLRASSLDELPGLINVIGGSMSLVGPRPLLMEYLPLYNQRQAKRHDVKPGITGWAQVNGRNAISWQQKFELDVWYVENHSFWLDIKIILLTLLKVVKRDGISQDGHVTMTKFTGNESHE